MNFRKQVIGLLCLSLLTSCTTTPKTEREPAAVNLTPLEQFKKAADQALDFRARALNFVEATNVEGEEKVLLTREQNDLIRESGLRYLKLRETLLNYALEGEPYFAPMAITRLTPYRGTYEKKLTPDIKNKEVGWIANYDIDPMDDAGKVKLANMKKSLAASLLLLDNYLIAIKPFHDNAETNYLLNYDVVGEDGKAKTRVLQEIVDSYSSSSRRDAVARAIKFVDEELAWKRKNGIDTTDEEDYYLGLIQSSVWYLAVKNNKDGSSFLEAVANLWHRLGLRKKRALRIASFGVSMGFGNLTGLHESRKGYLLKMPQAEKQALIAEMKPLDVLFEKTPFRLTDKMIPGHYGHVAIWIGTEQQLKELRVWDQIRPDVQQKIRSGHHIVEALRPGVQINTLDHFLNIDDFMVLRDNRNVTDDYRRKAILTTVAQIGKEYDFNFDVNTSIRIVCSEIAYVVYSDVKFPTSRTLRRNTISPDNVVDMAVNGHNTFKPVILYYNGKRYYKDLNHSIELLLEATDESYKKFAAFHADGN